MLIVETIARIRREHFIKGKTIKEIARDLKVSRNTVRKVLRSGETSFEYERRCAAITSSTRSPARLHPAGRRARSRTRSGLSAKPREGLQRPLVYLSFCLVRCSQALRARRQVTRPTLFAILRVVSDR